MLQIPAVVAMSIAATRMHRSLVDFTCGPSDGCVILHFIPSPAHNGHCQCSVHEKFQTSDLKFAKPKPPHARPIPIDPLETTVDTVSEKELSDPDSSINIDTEVHQKQNGSSFDEDVERGE